MGNDENDLLVKNKIKPKGSINCHHCKKSFTRKFDLKKHIKKFQFHSYKGEDKSFYNKNLHC